MPIKRFLLLLLFVPIFVFGQEMGTIKIIDASTKAIIPNTNLSINKTVYFPSDENGNIHFERKGIKNGDSLFISCIGYLTVKIVFNDAISLPKEITLRPIQYQLNEVVVSKVKGKQKEVIVGTEAFSLSESFTQANSKYALYINNSNEVKGTIKEIRIHMRNGAKSIDMPFKAGLYARNPNTKFPGNSLMEEIITENKEKKKWFAIDISHLSIKIPDEGFFIVFETMPIAYYSKMKEKIHGWNVSRVPGLAFTTFPKSVNKENYSLRSVGNRWVKSTVEYQMQAKILLQN